MFLRTIKRLKFVLSASFVAGCLFLTAAIANEEVINSCADLEEQLTVAYCDEYEDSCNVFELYDGRLRKIGTETEEAFAIRLRKQPSGSSASDNWKDVNHGFKREIQEQVLDNPVAIGSRHGHLASGITAKLKFDEYSPKHELALVHRVSNRILWMQNLDGYLDNIAWSPKGSALAALLKAPAINPKKNLLDYIVKVFGKKMARKRAWLEVYNLKGQMLCKVNVFDNQPSMSVSLLWRPK